MRRVLARVFSAAFWLFVSGLCFTGITYGEDTDTDSMKTIAVSVWYRERSLLFWLNRQERPSSIYVSMARNDDLLMRTWGPDRNQVAVLSGGPREILTKGAAARYFAQIIISHIEHAVAATPFGLRRTAAAGWLFPPARQ